MVLRKLYKLCTLHFFISSLLRNPNMRKYWFYVKFDFSNFQHISTSVADVVVVCWHNIILKNNPIVMQLHIPHQCSKRMNEFAIQQYPHRFSKIRAFLEIFWTFKFNNNVFLRENEKIFTRRWTHSIFLLFLSLYSLNLNQSNFHWLNQWFALSLIQYWKQYFSLLNQFIFAIGSVTFHWVINEIWLLHSNLFLDIWIGQIAMIISRFWLIQI